MYLLGLDIGSSSVKVSLVNAKTGEITASDYFPKTEAPILSIKSGWAEQDPEMWWDNMKLGLANVMKESDAKAEEIAAIGISYQMHGLVCVDKDQSVLRPSIIWCDSRAVVYGEKACNEIGENVCLSRLLNSPGNFTACKLAWVKDNEPEIFGKIYKFMLPGDYIAMRLSGEINTTVEGLSECMLWDFKDKKPAKFLLDYFGIDESLTPEIVPTFGIQCKVNAKAARELRLKEGTPISYRAGDQPNNALSLNVFNPGEIASTAGTSGVVYGISGKVEFDPLSRVNTFAHVNYTPELTRLGIMACINGTGILNAWMRRTMAPEGMSYAEMNDVMESVPVGSDGVSIIPFGNGAERVIQNKEIGCSVHGVNFNKHNKATLMRAAQEGIVFSFCYGIDIMKGMGMEMSKIHAGKANMFLSDIFRNTLAGTSGVAIELYETDGATGAARGAGMGCGIYNDNTEAFSSLKKLEVIEPDTKLENDYLEAYSRWKEILKNQIKFDK